MIRTIDNYQPEKVYEKPRTGPTSRCVVTPEMVYEVEQMSGLGLTQEQIHNYYGWGKATWYQNKKKHPEIKQAVLRGKSRCIKSVWAALYQSAINGNITAQIFWLKVNAGARDNHMIDVTPSDRPIKKLAINTTDPIEASKIYQQIMLGD